MSLQAPLTSLYETATENRVGGHALNRLAAAQSLLADDLRAIDEAIRCLAGSGPRPATDAALHLNGGGGKRVRPIAVLLSAACFGPISQVARDLAAVAELIHLATLLHDDVLDDADERRGRETSRRVWGNAVSVLSGDLLLTHALGETQRVAPGETLSDLIATLQQLVSGEVVQLRGRRSLDVTEAIYFQIVEDKTASLFSWATRAGARVGGGDSEQIAALGRYGKHLGVAFQLVDDALDYVGEAAAIGKGLHADLMQGKLTLPLTIAVRKRPKAMGDVLLARNGDEAAALRVVGAVAETGACDEVRKRAQHETGEAMAALDTIPAGVARDLLAAVAADLVKRLM